jgi:hypothetical protein
MCRKNLKLKFALVISTGLLLGPALEGADGAIMTINTTAPTVDGADIALLPGATTTTEGNFMENLVFHDVAYHGQTFTTGSNPTGYTMTGMSALHFQASIVGTNWNIGDFRLAVGTIDGSNNFTSLVTEDIPAAATGTVTQNLNQWVHLTLGSTLNLNPNTEYAFVLGIPTLNHFGFRWTQSTVNTDYAGGRGFSDSPPVPNISFDDPMILRNFDRIFHVDLEANELPPATTPEPSTCLLALLSLATLCACRKRRAYART